MLTLLLNNQSEVTPPETMEPLDRLAIKRHLNIWSQDTFILPLIAAMEDGGALQTEAAQAITDCNTALAAIVAAQTEADDITEGGGAKFNPNLKISIKRRQYKDFVNDLARIIGYPQSSDTASITGFMSL